MHLNLNLNIQQTAQNNTTEITEVELGKLHRDNICPFFSAALQNSKALTNDEMLKFDDGIQIPIAEIIESITFDDVPNGNYDTYNCATLVLFLTCE